MQDQVPVPEPKLHPDARFIGGLCCFQVLLTILSMFAPGTGVAQSRCQLNCSAQHLCLGPGDICTTDDSFRACLAQCAAHPDPPPEPDVWGALAVSASTLASGSSWNYKSEAAASKAALGQCRARGGTDCKVVTTVADVCVALAVSNAEKTYAVGGPTGAGNYADDAAMLKCQRAGGKSCFVQASFCADGQRHQLNGHTVTSNGNPIFVPDRRPAPAPPLAAAPAAGDDTARFYGSWTASFPVNGQTMTVLSVHDARGYRNFNVTSGGNAPLDTGTFSAAHGRYHTSAPKPNDSGTYRFLDSDTAECTNAAGETLTWRRQGKPVDANTAAKALTNYSPPTERPGTTTTKK
ncbi:MAG: DUF4189 domain-containing protein [Proteobacteria bacterium]|nr:DUF4189 domain-containing protein [Pseudomonadota bacterium]